MKLTVIVIATMVASSSAMAKEVKNKTMTWEACATLGKMAEEGSVLGVKMSKVLDNWSEKAWMTVLRDGPVSLTCRRDKLNPNMAQMTIEHE